VSENRREADRDQQDDDQDVLELLGEDLPRRYPVGGLELIWPVLRQAATGLWRS
jgi:hypothetical protein